MENPEENIAVGPSGYGIGDTTEVGSYPSGASPYGAIDMSGNVVEWVNDWFAEDYYDSSPYSNPPGPSTGSEKVLRGGDFSDVESYARAAKRLRTGPDGIYGIFGFRCAVDGD